MAKVDVLDILRAKKASPLEFNFDSLWIPPIYCYLLPQDIEALRKIATSIKLSSKLEQKYQMIDNIMRARGFKRFSAGTNRVVYSCQNDDRFVVKIAIDKVGMQDNPREYENQFLLKPYVTKMFYISPCGTVGFAERVLPIKNRGEFKEIASDVFDILVHRILGKYVVEDVGVKYFMNWGIRFGQSPVLLDYPYVYKLDGKKLFCTKQDPITGIRCDGEIDYDSGFNHLVCTRCGKVYLASDLRDNSIDNKIIIKGGTQMKIALKEGDTIISTPIPTDDVIVRPKSRPDYKTNGLVVGINEGDGVIVMTNTENAVKPNSEEKKIDIEVSTNLNQKEEISDDKNENKIDDLKKVDIPDEETPSEDSNNESDDEEDNSSKEDSSESDSHDEDVSSNENPDDSNTTKVEEKEEAPAKKSSPERDEKGRFISTGPKKPKEKKNKVGSTFIPSK